MSTELLQKLYSHRAYMAPHHKEREGGKLLLEAITEIERLSKLLRGEARQADTQVAREDSSDGTRLCAMCGARVTNLNPKCNTCDPICTRAKHNSVNRQQQVEIDILSDRLVENGWIRSEADAEAARSFMDAGQEDGM